MSKVLQEAEKIMAEFVEVKEQIQQVNHVKRRCARWRYVCTAFFSVGGLMVVCGQGGYLSLTGLALVLFGAVGHESSRQAARWTEAELKSLSYQKIKLEGQFLGPPPPSANAIKKLEM